MNHRATFHSIHTTKNLFLLICSSQVLYRRIISQWCLPLSLTVLSCQKEKKQNPPWVVVGKSRFFFVFFPRKEWARHEEILLGSHPRYIAAGVIQDRIYSRHRRRGGVSRYTRNWNTARSGVRYHEKNRWVGGVIFQNNGGIICLLLTFVAFHACPSLK